MVFSPGWKVERFSFSSICSVLFAEAFPFCIPSPNTQMVDILLPGFQIVSIPSPGLVMVIMLMPSF
jgi:hypothetical protein